MGTPSKADDAARALVLEPGEGQAMWFVNSRMTLKATAESTGGAYGLLESVIPPGFSPPLHVHHREEESYFVLEGRLTLQCGDEVRSIGAGSFVVLPRQVPHTFVVEGDTPARMLTLITPGGGEGFFVDVSRPAETGGLPPIGPVDVEQLRRVGAEYGDEVVGPPLSPTSAG
jgi:mannose-6-phosphate isomerase-like protein (cupin superfamily)